jgi:hypothetical protein
MAILTVRTSGLGLAPTALMADPVLPSKTLTPPGFAPRYIAPAQRTTSTFGPPKLDRPAAPLPSKAAVETEDNFIAETTAANVAQGSADAQDVIKTEEGGTSTNDVVTPANGGGSQVTRIVQPTPAGMSTGKKVAIGLGVGLAAVALFSFLR